MSKIGGALGLPEGALDYYVACYLNLAPDSVEDISLRMHRDGFDSWKLHLFNMVDRFRHDQSLKWFRHPPIADLDPKLQALVTSTVEALCDERSLTAPSWCRSIPGLPHPWFVSGIENLKAMALVESPAFFRARNIFVLGNFLDRA